MTHILNCHDPITLRLLLSPHWLRRELAQLDDLLGDSLFRTAKPASRLGIDRARWSFTL
jgi:hypothetical protein